MGWFGNWFNEKKEEEQLKPFQTQLKEKYIKMGYLTIPYIPEEQEAKRIVTEKFMQDTMLVPKDNMKPVISGILKGDIVLLWWLDNPRTKMPYPKYFTFQYGINPADRVEVLEAKHCLEFENNKIKVTEKGKKLLNELNFVVRDHKAVQTVSTSGKTKYVYDDAESVSGQKEFKSSHDFIEDQHIGRAFERAQNYGAAIAAYQSAIRLAKRQMPGTPPSNPYLRQAIIYRKLKQYDKEVAIIKEALKHAKYPKLMERLEKAKALLDKQNGGTLK